MAKSKVSSQKLKCRTSSVSWWLLLMIANIRRLDGKVRCIRYFIPPNVCWNFSYQINDATKALAVCGGLLNVHTCLYELMMFMKILFPYFLGYWIDCRRFSAGFVQVPAQWSVILWISTQLLQSYLLRIRQGTATHRQRTWPHRGQSKTAGTCSSQNRFWWLEAGHRVNLQ